MLAAGQKFLALPEADKDKWPFNPDTYLGHRGSKELETVTGALRHHARVWQPSSLSRLDADAIMHIRCPGEHLQCPAEALAAMLEHL